MENRFVTIASFPKVYEAHLAKLRLVAEGIPAYLLDEHLISLHWFYSEALGGVKVQVPKEHGELAKKIIFTDHREELSEMFEMEPPILCLKCGNESTLFPLGEPWVAVLTWMWVGIPFIIWLNKRKCNHCGHLFDTPPPSSS